MRGVPTEQCVVCLLQCLCTDCMGVTLVTHSVVIFRSVVLQYKVQECVLGGITVTFLFLFLVMI